MSIHHAILGLLSWKPHTGYDLKKVFEESAFMHWSGNNNQIYRPLLQLEAQGLAACEVRQPENGPAKKLYHITDAGRKALSEWVRATPEPMEIRKTFLIQLSWTNGLDDTEVDRLLGVYVVEVLTQIAMQREKNRRGQTGPFLSNSAPCRPRSVPPRPSNWARRSTPSLFWCMVRARMPQPGSGMRLRMVRITMCSRWICPESAAAATRAVPFWREPPMQPGLAR